MARRPQLPLEIWETVIDDVSDDSPSLYACSLTCKSWTPRCRSHIFSEVTLHQVPQMSTFVDIVQSPTRPGQHVRTLWLYHDLDLSAMWSILAENLTAVRELGIEKMQWPDDNGHRAILSGFQTVQELKLYSGNFPTLTELLELVESFPLLNSLSCDDVGFDDENMPTHIINPAPPSFTRLKLDGPAMIPAIKWLLTTECHISDVTLDVCSDERMWHCSELLKRLGQSVKRLCLAIPQQQDSWSHTGIGIDLSQNILLRSLRLSRVGRPAQRVEGFFNVVPQILSQIRSNEMHSLQLYLWFDGDEVHLFPWNRVECILGEPRFSPLQNVTLSFYTTRFDIRSLVKEKWPNLTKRVAVRVQGKLI